MLWMKTRRKAEICELDMTASIKQNIVWLDVSVWEISRRTSGAAQDARIFTINVKMSRKSSSIRRQAGAVSSPSIGPPTSLELSTTVTRVRCRTKRNRKN